MYQMYLQFLRDVDIELKKTVEQSTELLKEHLIQRTCKQQDHEFVNKKMDDFKFQVDKYHLQAAEKFKENLKANIEGPVQTQTHFLAMKNQRQKSKSFKSDDLEKILDIKISEANDKQKLSLLHYLDTFEEEFKNQNSSLLTEYEKLEAELISLQLQD